MNWLGVRAWPSRDALPPPGSLNRQIVIYFRYLTEVPTKEDAMLFTEDERTEAIHREPQTGWFYGYVGTWEAASVQDELPPSA